MFVNIISYGLYSSLPCCDTFRFTEAIVQRLSMILPQTRHNIYIQNAKVTLVQPIEWHKSTF